MMMFRGAAVSLPGGITMALGEAAPAMMVAGRGSWSEGREFGQATATGRAA